MSYTFAKLKTRLDRGVLRDDLADDYGDFINEALREIQNRRSWTVMKAETTVTIPVGSGRETADLPTDFKEFQPAPAVLYVAEDGQYIPADLVTEEQQIYRLWAFGGTPITTWPPRVFTEKQATKTILGVLEPLVQEFVLRVKYFNYLPDLEDAEDTSPLADLYPKMVLAKARAIAFTDINDDIAEQNEREFEKKLGEAIRQDAYSLVAGRTLRM